MSLVKISSDYWVKLFKDDPVRPNLTPKFRLTENRVNFLLTQDFSKPCAIICVAYTKEIPKTEKQLEIYSMHKLSVNYDKAILFLERVVNSPDSVMQNSTYYLASSYLKNENYYYIVLS